VGSVYRDAKSVNTRHNLVVVQFEFPQTGVASWTVGNLGMKKPSLKITKGLAGEIPVEGLCTACPDIIFHVSTLSEMPTVEEGTAKLQKLFDEHFRRVHLPEDASQAAARIVREATED
jgi:hypothetical protein